MKTGKIFRGVRITFISIVAILAIILFLPELFPGFVAKKIKSLANEHIEAELHFKKARFSFVKHFPALTFSVLDFSITGKGQFTGDTLVAGKELAFGVNIFTLFKERISLNQFFLEDGFINIKVDSLGNGNYDIAKDNSNSEADTLSAESNTNLRIERIRIANTRFRYADASLPMVMEMDTLDYDGKGDLTKEIVDLMSTVKAKGVSLQYDGESYAVKKRLNAELITRINTESLELSFTKNDLMVNELPLDFTGFVRFPESGYEVDLRFKAEKTNLRNVITVLPPAYLAWLDKTEVKGMASLFLNFIGMYNAQTRENPSLSFGLTIENGFVRNADAPVPVTDLGMRFRLDIPGLNYDSFAVNLDTLHIKVGKGFVNSKVQMTNLNFPSVKASVKANADLEELIRAIGYKEMNLQGSLVADGFVDYNSATDFNPKTKRMPYAKASLQWQRGLIQTSYYPAPVKDINMKVVLSNASGTYRDMEMDLQPITFTFEDQPFMLKAVLKDFESLQYNMESKGKLDIGKIARVFVPEEYGVTAQGFMETDFNLKGTQADAKAGRYSRLNNQGTITLKDINIKSKELPLPLLISKGRFNIDNDKLNTNDLVLTYGSNQLLMKGFYNNLFSYLIGTGPLRGGLSVLSNKLNLNEFLANQPNSDTLTYNAQNAINQESSGVVMLPKNLELQLEADIKEATYDQFFIRDVKGKASLKNGKLTLKDAGAKMAGAKGILQASYEPLSTTSALFDVDIKADSFDIQRFYKEVPLFAEMASSAKDVEGQVSLKYKIAGKLDANMMPVKPSIKGGGTLSLHNVELKGFKLFSAVSKKTGKDSLNNPNLKAVDLNTTINNNVMTLERTRMRIFGFRPRLEGQATLDGRLNLRFRLGLPPFGIIGIPMTITGTMENPIVEMRKGKEEDELKETEEKDS